ncbi:MAG: nuclear transport factor 2 family protein [Pseudomonadota bacterium]|nr:nuclear transport factor 2 family protein [Pseudomonadota bacterium]
MQRLLLFLAASVVLLPLLEARAQDPADACVVWEREAGFARSVAEHDPEAFTSYLHPDAVFIDGRNQATRGAGTIAENWSGIIEGKDIVLRWYPDSVDVGASGLVALVRGPYWMEIPAAPAEQRYRRGRFVSTWLRGNDGQWQVVFDGGGGNKAVPATAAEIAGLMASQGRCPARQAG